MASANRTGVIGHASITPPPTMSGDNKPVVPKVPSPRKPSRSAADLATYRAASHLSAAGLARLGGAA